MKALTVCQPWAWAIIQGIKRVENRTWRTKHRGPLVIHAGLSTKWLAEWVGTLPDGTPIPEGLQYGAVLGEVDVVDCVPVAEAPASPFAFGPWCWLLENPRPLETPLKWRGGQMLWNFPGRISLGQCSGCN